MSKNSEKIDSKGTPELVNWLREEAKKEGRTLSGLVRWILELWKKGREV